jgi:signal transduction histidine kinase
LAAEKDVGIEFRGIGAVVSGVEIALDRALSNLVDNAVRAAPPGSTVVVGSGAVDEWAWLGVRDSGRGLPDGPGDRVGLGLSIVTQIAEGHGGALASFSGKGEQGTTMVMWLPREGAAGSPPRSSPFTDT